MSLYLTPTDAAGRSIEIEAPGNLTFTTQLPGGCGGLSFTWDAELTERFPEYEHPRMQFCTLSDGGGDVLFAGVRQTTSWGDGTSTYGFDGYWATLNFLQYGRAAMTTPTYPDDVLKAIVRVSGLFLETDTTLIERNAVDIAEGSAENLLQTRGALAVVQDMLRVPGVSGERWSAAVWADRRLRYFPVSELPTWHISLSDFGRGWSFQRDNSDVYSGVVIAYTDTGAAAAQYQAHNAETQAYLGYPKVYPDPIKLPEKQLYSATTVARIGRLWLARHNRPQQRTGAVTLTTPEVVDAAGNARPTYRIRAGDVVRVTDMPLRGDASELGLDDLSTFLVARTSYNAANRTMALTFDNTGHDITAWVARLADGQAP